MGKKEGTVTDRPGKVEHQMERGMLFEIEFVDDQGNAMVNHSYTLEFTGGKLISGVTDEKGIGKHWDVPDEDFEIVVEESDTEST